MQNAKWHNGRITNWIFHRPFIGKQAQRVDSCYRRRGRVAKKARQTTTTVPCDLNCKETMPKAHNPIGNFLQFKTSKSKKPHMINKGWDVSKLQLPLF